jgi:hypothetical protein
MSSPNTQLEIQIKKHYENKKGPALVKFSPSVNNKSSVCIANESDVAMK